MKVVRLYEKLYICIIAYSGNIQVFMKKKSDIAKVRKDMNEYNSYSAERRGISDGNNAITTE